MRAAAIVVLFCLVALAAILVAHYCFPGFQPTQPHKPPRHHRGHRPAPLTEAPLVATNSQPSSQQPPPAGFYIGKGGERVYIDYGTPDPVLRSLLQSVMENGSDPNEQGKQIYQRICGACHQREGEGKDGVAPPLAGSEWVLSPGGTRLARIVLNGLTGPIQVQGRQWNLTMLPWRQNLDDDQIAAVLTFIRSGLSGNRAAPIRPELIALARKEVRTTPETASELLRIAEQ